MIIDFYTKTVLTMIAVALTVIALNPWITPKPARADTESWLSQIHSEVSFIGPETTALRSHLSGIKSIISGISGGTCANSKIC